MSVKVIARAAVAVLALGDCEIRRPLTGVRLVFRHDPLHGFADWASGGHDDAAALELP